MEKKMQVQNRNDEIDLKELFFVLLDRVWILILSAVICAVAAGVYTKTMVTPMYKSTSLMYILDKNTVVSLSDIQLGTQLTKDYTVVIKTRPVIEKVIENLELDITYEQFRSNLTISNPADTRFIELTYMDPDPEMAKKIADEVAIVARSQVKAIMNTQEPTIAEYGHIPTAPSSPSTKKNVMMAGLLGAFAAAFVIVLLHLMNDRIKSGEDLEKYLGLTMLGMIPAENEQKNHKKSKRKK